MPKWIKVLSALGCIGAAPSAFAIPLNIEISSTSYVAGAGLWSLSGPTSTTQFWAVGPGDTYSSGAEVLDGDYTWSIFGGAGGFGSISWTVLLGSQSVYSGSDQGWFAFKVSDSTVFQVGSGPVSVPEPETLLLLGSGLVTMALSIRRRLKAKS